MFSRCSGDFVFRAFVIGSTTGYRTVSCGCHGNSMRVYRKCCRILLSFRYRNLTRIGCIAVIPLYKVVMLSSRCGNSCSRANIIIASSGYRTITSRYHRDCNCTGHLCPFSPILFVARFRTGNCRNSATAPTAVSIPTAEIISLIGHVFSNR